MVNLKEKEALYFLIYTSIHAVAGYPYEIEVTNIKATSATLQWKSTEMTVQDFSIHCAGKQKYKTRDGEVHNTEMHMQSQYVPKGLLDVTIGGLRPNYNYSCVIKEKVEEGTEVFNGRVSKPVIFRTDVADLFTPTALKRSLYHLCHPEKGSFLVRLREKYISAGSTMFIPSPTNYQFTIKTFQSIAGHWWKTLCEECTDTAPPQLEGPVITKEAGVTHVSMSPLDNDKAGPVMGYAVQFHLVTNPILHDIPIEYDRTDPFGKLAPINLEYARVSEQPLSFQILFKKSIPKRIHIDQDLMNGALKNGAMYRVIVVPYVQSRNVGILFTPSKPSVSFVAFGISHDDYETAPVQELGNNGYIKIAIVVGILLPVLCLIYMCCIGAAMLSYEVCWSQKRDPRKRRFADTFRKKLDLINAKCILCQARCCRCRNDFELLPLSETESAEDNRKHERTLTYWLKKGRSAKSPKYKRVHVLYPVETDKIKSARKKCKKKQIVCGGGPSLQENVAQRFSPLANQQVPIRKQTKYKEYPFTPPPPEEMEQEHDIESPLHKAKSCMKKTRQSPKQQVKMESSFGALKYHSCPHHQHPYSEPMSRSKPLSHSDCYMHPDLRYPHGTIHTQNSHLQKHQTSFQQLNSKPHVSQDHSNKRYVKGTDDLRNTRPGILQRGTDRNSSRQSNVNSPNYSMSVSASKKPNFKVSRSEDHKVPPTILSESSGSTLIPEDGYGQALEYTTSASVIDKPISHNTDEFFSPYESDRLTDELQKPFTRSSYNTPLRHMSSKLSCKERLSNHASSTDGLDLVSLSSSLSQTDVKGLGHALDILH